MDNENKLSYYDLGKGAVFALLCIAFAFSIGMLTGITNNIWLVLALVLFPFYMYRMVQLFHDGDFYTYHIILYSIFTLVVSIGGLVHDLTTRCTLWKLGVALYTFLIAFTIINTIFLVITKNDDDPSSKLYLYALLATIFGLLPYFIGLNMISIKFSEGGYIKIYLLTLLPMVIIIFALILQAILYYVYQHYINNEIEDMEDEIDNLKLELYRTSADLNKSNNAKIVESIERIERILNLCEGNNIANETDNSIETSCTNASVAKDVDDNGDKK